MNSRPILPPKVGIVRFHFAYGFATQILAQAMDSLVRVSRRVIDHHLAESSILALEREYGLKL